MSRFLPQPLTLQSAVVGQSISHDFLHRVFFVSTSSSEQSAGIDDSGRLYLAHVPSYASNAAAIAGGLVAGTVYQTNGTLMIVY